MKKNLGDALLGKGHMKKRRHMKKNRINGLIILLFLTVALGGCSMKRENPEPSADLAADADKNTEMQDTRKEGQVKTQDNPEVIYETGQERFPETDTQIPVNPTETAEISAPSKEQVLAAREQAFQGMSEEETARLTENIKIANLQMESAYLNDNLFEKLEDSDSLYWNYFDEKGDIQIGWVYHGSLEERKALMENENLSWEEVGIQYGDPEMVYNRFHAQNFIDLLEEMKGSVQNEALRADLQQIMDETALAAETHDMEHACKIYQLLHDLDYYLLRYGPEDVGKYVQDTSLISRYYGVLSVYNDSGN